MILLNRIKPRRAPEPPSRTARQPLTVPEAAAAAAAAIAAVRAERPITQLANTDPDTLLTARCYGSCRCGTGIAPGDTIISTGPWADAWACGPHCPELVNQ